MSAPLLFKISAGIFALMPIGHTQMAMDLVYPGLKALGDTPAAYSSKTSWTQANGYFITSALLCLKWANQGVQEGLDKYIFAALMVTHFCAGGAYLKKGIMPPTLCYWTTNVLMGIAALQGA